MNGLLSFERTNRTNNRNNGSSPNKNIAISRRIAEFKGQYHERSSKFLFYARIIKVPSLINKITFKRQKKA